MGEVECAAMRVRVTMGIAWRGVPSLGTARARGARIEVIASNLVESMLFIVEIVDTNDCGWVLASFLVFVE